LTASPWRLAACKPAEWVRSFILIVLFVTGYHASNAQVHLPSIPFIGPSTLYTNLPAGSGTGGLTPSLPLITGGTTVCVGTTTVLSNTTTGGTWTSGNTAIATVNPVSGLVTGVHGGVVVVTYTVGIYSTTTTITVTQPIAGGTAVCAGNALYLTDSTFTGNWTSSNPSVATVTPVSMTGLAEAKITGVAAGTAVISYGRTGACFVTDTVVVGSNGVAAINGTGVLGICAGSTLALTDGTTGGTWSSSTPAVATIGSATGIATGIAVGTTTITYTVGTCFQTRALMVNTVSAIAAITPASPTVCIGSTTALADATGLGTWSTADATKATINTSGVVTGVAVGTVVISYSKGGCSQTTTVTVNTNTTGAITGTMNICIGTTGTLNCTPSGGQWSINDTAYGHIVATTGVITGTIAGSPIITYTQGGCFNTATIAINPASSVGAISGSTAICQNATSAYTDAVPGGSWTSSNTAVATINSYGTLTGVANGSATLTYTRLGCTATKSVTINPLPGAITGTMSVCKGLTQTLADTSTTGTWSTTNAAVATVGTTGIVTGVGNGTDTIIYTYPTGCYQKASFVVNGPAAITGNSIDCIAPLTYLMLADATFGGTYTSSNTLVATVGAATGAVTGVAGGTVTITYTQAGTGCYVTKPVTVNYAPGLITGNFTTCAGSTTVLADTAGGGVWTSSNPAIATVGTTGIVSGIATGGTLISYTKNGCTQTANVSVAASVNPITGPNTVCAGYATIALADATPGGEWSTTSTYFYLSSGGVVTGGSVVTGMVTTGVVNYTVGGCTVSTTITVNPNPITAPSGLPSVCNGSSITMTDLSPGGGVWTSQNPAIASVGSASGIVTGLAAGTSAITFTGTGGCFKTFEVAVNDTPHTITGSWTVCAGTVTALGGETGLGHGWITSNSAIAAVDTIGNVTGIAVGTATITFARAGGCAVYHNMTVLALPSAMSFKTSAAVCIGGVADSVKDATAGGTWSSSATGVLGLGGTASDGYTALSGVSAGTSVLTYTGANGCYTTTVVTVNATPTSPITGNTPTCVTSVLQLSDATAPGLGTWASATTAKATINATSGLVTGVATGTSVISYTYQGCIATTTVTVNANNVGAITGSSTVCLSDTTTLFDTTAGGTWSTNNSAIATIGSANGLVSGVSTGFAIITYTSPAGCMVYLNPFNVTNPLPALTGANTVCKGLTTVISDAVAGGTWSTTSSAIATILTNGTLTGVATGSTNVTYSMAGCLTNPPVMTVTVLAVPTAFTGFPYSNKVCQGSTTVLTEGVSGGTWTTSDYTLALILSASATTATIQGVAYGVPYITYTLPDGCFVSTVMSVGMPASAISGSIVCTGNITTFSDVTPGGSWSVSNSNAIIDATLGVLNPGTITTTPDTLTVFYTTPGCTAVTYPVTINPAPAPITGTFSVCKLSTTTLADTTSGGVWTSSNTAYATIGSATGVVTGVSGGTLNITFTAPNGCTDVQSFYVDPCGLKNSPAPVANTATEQVYSLFPNPTSGTIHINQSIPVDGVMQVTVINAVGSKVYAGPVTFAGGDATLNIAGASGMYLVLLQDNSNLVQTFKVLLEK